MSVEEMPLPYTSQGIGLSYISDFPGFNILHFVSGAGAEINNKTLFLNNRPGVAEVVLHAALLLIQ